jgi:predicted acetyltransferase
MKTKQSILRLVQPSVEFMRSHETFLEEFFRLDEEVVPWIVAEPYDDFADYVAMLHDASRGIGIPSNFVPHSTYWLIDDRGEIVAISNLRHRLNDELLGFGGHIGYGVRPTARQNGFGNEVLRQTLLEARARGIDRARLTCARDNIASARTIVRNGGQLDEEEFMLEHNEVISRYWIDL